MKSFNLLNILNERNRSDVIKGNIIKYPITQYLTWIEMNFTAIPDSFIKLHDFEDNGTYYIYNFGDDLRISTTARNLTETLLRNQSVIIKNLRTDKIRLNFDMNGTYKLGIIQYAKFNINDKSDRLFVELESYFEESIDTDNILMSGIPSLKSGEYARAILAMNKTTIPDRMMVSGFCSLLVSIELKHFTQTHNLSEYLSKLSDSEIQRIHAIAEEIDKNPGGNFAVYEISKKYYISESKLQLGFRELHGSSFNSYITYKRLLKSESLLKDSNLSISEIVYTVGYTSRSYFSKIFKFQFGHTPTQFRRLYVEHLKNKCHSLLN